VVYARNSHRIRYLSERAYLAPALRGASNFARRDRAAKFFGREGASK
jgi:hypothetical protein